MFGISRKAKSCLNVIEEWYLERRNQNLQVLIFITLEITENYFAATQQEECFSMKKMSAWLLKYSAVGNVTRVTSTKKALSDSLKSSIISPHIGINICVRSKQGSPAAWNRFAVARLRSLKLVLAQQCMCRSVGTQLGIYQLGGGASILNISNALS